jgi:hypothetical protein
MPQYVHTAQTATFANLAFILAALICARLLPKGALGRMQARRRC